MNNITDWNKFCASSWRQMKEDCERRMKEEEAKRREEAKARKNNLTEEQKEQIAELEGRKLMIQLSTDFLDEVDWANIRDIERQIDKIRGF